MSQQRAAARRALADVPINVGFAGAVVDELVDGELWSDRPEAPRAFHAVHPSGMSLVWGPDVPTVADAVVRHVRHRASLGRVGEWLQVEPRWAGSVDWAGALHAVVHTRVNFVFDPAAFAEQSVRPADSVQVRRATVADFAWDGSTVPNRYWPDAEAFLAHGWGWVAEADGTPAALAFRAFPGAHDVEDVGDVEIGIETRAAYRRRGLARVVAAAMIEDVLASGRTPVWSCREENVGSLRLAESLGFTPSRRLPYLEVRQPPDELRSR